MFRKIVFSIILTLFLLDSVSLAYNLSEGRTQSLGCVTIKVQYQDGCPRPNAEVWVVDPFQAVFGITNESGLVSRYGWLQPGDYIVQAFYPTGVQFGVDTYLYVDSNGDGSTTIKKYPTHPHAFIMNLTSSTNNVRFVENALNDSSTTKDLTFGSNENQTVWIALPKKCTVLDAKLTLTGLFPYPTNPFFDVGNDSVPEWSYTGEFNSSQVVSYLLSTAIRDYLSNTTLNERGLVDIPVILHSDTAGNIRISGINVIYDYDTSYLYSVRYIASPFGYNINHTTYYNCREVGAYGYYIDDDSTLAKVDGIQCPIKMWNGHQYVEFPETILEDAYWHNHTIWWDTLQRPLTLTVTSSDSVGNPKETFETGAMAHFTVKVNKTNVNIEPALLMTVNVLDSDNASIGVASFQGPVMPGISTFIIGVLIPLSAHLGNASVYANAYTDWPHNGGVPYCLEALAGFRITNGTGSMATGKLQITSLDQSALLSSSPIIQNYSRMNLTAYTNKTCQSINKDITIYGNLTHDGMPISENLVAIEVQNSNGDPVVIRSMQTDSYGAYNFTFKLPSNARRGLYTTYSGSTYRGEVATSTIQIFVTIAGDVTSATGLPDGRVDMRDIGAICSKFGTKPSSPNWDPNYDINDDQIVNMRDIGIACNNFMK